MERIEGGRYQHPEDHGWAGWINPEREQDETIPKWALFITVDGHVALGVRDEEGLNFGGPFGTDHPRTFTLESGEPVP